jgi:predicted nuclease of predicted toxin-antitoxin system
MEQTRVADVDPTIALSAAKPSQDLALPMTDSLILATARCFDATLWTQDSDFVNLPDVKYVGKKS